MLEHQETENARCIADSLDRTQVFCTRNILKYICIEKKAFTGNPLKIFVPDSSLYSDSINFFSFLVNSSGQSKNISPSYKMENRMDTRKNLGRKLAQQEPGND